MAVTDNGSVLSWHGHQQQRCRQAPGTGNPRQPSSIRKRHTLCSLLLSFLLRKLTFIPSKHICHFKSASPWDILFYCNNLFAFPQLSVFFFLGSLERKQKKNQPTNQTFIFVFQIPISLSGVFCKNSP